ncbi:unnamed protein product [Effrenium voratum]|nr:unnamed protein product [Effrenium voratum]
MRLAAGHGDAVSVGKYGKQKAWGAALQLLGAARRRLLRRGSVAAWNSAASACQRCRQWRAAADALRDLERSALRGSLVTQNAGIAAATTWYEALGVLGLLGLRQFRPDAVSCNTALNACDQTWRQALGLLAAALTALTATVVTWNATISAGGKSEQWLQAVGVLDSAQSAALKADVISFNASMSACRWEAASGLFKELRGKALRPTAVTFGSTISACERSTSAQWPKAVHALCMAASCGVETGTIAYNACISALEQGQWEQVLCLFHRLMISGLQPSITTCNALITACASEEWRRALTTLLTLPSLKLRADIVTFNACIRACDEGGQWERALLLFSEAQRRRLQPSAVTYSSIITACAGRWRQVLLLLRAARDLSLADGAVCNAAVAACGAAACWEQGLSLLSLAGLQASSISFNAVISACAKAELWSQALRAFAALAAQPAARRWRRDAVAFNGAITACEKRLRWRFALGLKELQRGGGVRPTAVTFGAIVSACERSAKWQGAVHLLGAAEKELRPDAVAFNAAISAFEGLSRWRWCFDLGSRLPLTRAAPRAAAGAAFGSIVGAASAAAAWRAAAAALRAWRARSRAPPRAGWAWAPLEGWPAPAAVRELRLGSKARQLQLSALEACGEIMNPEPYGTSNVHLSLRPNLGNLVLVDADNEPGLVNVKLGPGIQVADGQGTPARTWTAPREGESRFARDEHGARAAGPPAILSEAGELQFLGASPWEVRAAGPGGS